MESIEVPTPHGPARVQLEPLLGARGALLLGHGAGGGVRAPDLQVAATAARAAGLAVARVEQPYRVAGRRAPAPAAQLDIAWLAVVTHLRAAQLSGLPLVFGGRSMGARIACRTATAGSAVAVLCLAFPLLPPRRAASRQAPVSRQPELEGTGVPTLVVQGARDPFGAPRAAPGGRVVMVSGDHSLRAGLPAVGAAVADWLTGLEL